MANVFKNFKENLSAQILFALILGILTGLFFGEKASAINFVGDAFLRLFQMPVIPYIVVSLVGSLGRLDLNKAKAIFIKGGAVMVAFWAIILTIVVVFPLGFPDWESASFFSTSSLETEKPLDLLALFIPLNPFEAMANTIVPSLVFFSICLGVALIPLPNKQPVIEVFSGLENGLLRISQAIAKLTPIGVFAIIANAAGTLPLEAFQRLQVYIILQAIIALILSLGLLPGLVALLTPLKYWDIIKAFRSPLLTAFATANLVIVIPLLIDRSREILSQIKPDLTEQSLEIASPVEVLVPASFVFPDMGRLISLSFIPFAAWFGGSFLPLNQYPGFLISGLASFFGDGLVAMRFLLKLFGMPVDLIQLYVTLDQVSVARFGTLLAGMNAAVLSLLGTCLINGWVRWRRPRILRFGLIYGLVILLTLGSVRLFFTYAVTNTYTKDQQLAQLELLRISDPQSAQVFTSPIPPLEVSRKSNQLAQIKSRGFIRVCYSPDDYPLSYINKQGRLVGLSIEMMHSFAKTLGVKLEFVPFAELGAGEFDEIGQKLNSGYCDLIGTPLFYTPEGSQVLSYSAPLLQQFTVGFIVKDKDTQKFSSWRSLKQKSKLHIGVLGNSNYYQAKLKGLLPNATLVELDSMEKALENNELGVDAIVYFAESGGAWTLLYPSYSIAIPKPLVSIPFAFAVRRNEPELKEVLDTWLVLKEQDGTIRSLFDYWVQGKTQGVEEPRWSIIRNVLGWVN